MTMKNDKGPSPVIFFQKKEGFFKIVVVVFTIYILIINRWWLVEDEREIKKYFRLVRTKSKLC